jgi:NagD protein
MDGVFVRDGHAIPGADKFLERLSSSGRSFLILTNNSMFSPRQLREGLVSVGLAVEEAQLWTSALATAEFVNTQRPGGTAYVIGEPSLHEALGEVGYTVSPVDPAYVVLGETQHYSFDEITTAIRLIDRGARFVATNPEPTGPSAEGSLPACGAVAALIQRATGVAPYFIGKPNPLMIREGLDTLGAHSSSTVMIGDRMETDILAGIEAGLETILVLSGVTTEAEVDRYPFRPSRIVASVADLVDEL